MPGPTGKVLGIDLGTTNSCMAVILQGELVVLPNAEGGRTTPSVVGFARDGSRVVGAIARQQAGAQPETTVFSVKRFMGRKLKDPSVEADRKMVPYGLAEAPNGDARVRLGDKEFSPPEISAAILAKLKADAEAHLGESIEAAVITVPAYFNDSQRQATKDAGRIAGLDVLRILNEPTAASLACGLDRKKNLRIAVYDLGGGTFDVSILELGKGIFEVRSTNGDTHLGGDDFDQAIIRLLIEEFKRGEGIDLSGDKLALQRLREAAETAKIQLSTTLQAEINLPFLRQGADGDKHLYYSLTREKLEELTRPLVEATLKPCERALQDAKLSKDKVDEVILVGGMTRMPAVVQAVTRFFGKQPHPGVNPDEAVAIGAAIQGGILRGEVRDTLLLDVTPLSLGVRTEGGAFSKIIEKNTTVPTRKSQVYTTAHDDQNSVRISVFQGEKSMAAENMFLADFELFDIKKAGRGVPQIEVVFDIDANGIIRVSAKDKETKISQQIRIEPNSGLRQDEIERMIKEAETVAKANETPPEVLQYRKTCSLLFNEAKKEIGESKKVNEDLRAQLLGHLRQYENGVNTADLAGLKDLLRELNQFLVEIRKMNKEADPV